MALQVPREMATRSIWPSVGDVLGGLPAELWLTVQCLRQVVVRGRLKRMGLCPSLSFPGTVNLGLFPH
jgi:hypothetical protein